MEFVISFKENLIPLGTLKKLNFSCLSKTRIGKVRCSLHAQEQFDKIRIRRMCGELTTRKSSIAFSIAVCVLGINFFWLIFSVGLNRST